MKARRKGTLTEKIEILRDKGLKPIEIAERLGATTNTVQVLLHRLKYPERHAEWMRKWNKANPSRRKQIAKSWRERNPEKVLELSYKQKLRRCGVAIPE